MATTQARSSTTKQIEGLGDTVHQSVDRATETAVSAADYVEREANDRLEALRDYVRENPITAIGIAAAAGYLLKMLRG
jgi:ElaB/YqjD/DUF883 family membrane-anchored ribosome-binding protein